MTMFEKNENVEDILDDLEAKGLISYDEETELPVKTKDHYRHLRQDEVCSVILPYIAQNIKISNAELERLTGISRATIGKARKSEKFTKLLIEHTNRKMLIVRKVAVDELLKILQDDKANQNTKIKAIHEALSHTEKMTELMIMSGHEAPKINIDALIAELENM